MNKKQAGHRGCSYYSEQVEARSRASSQRHSSCQAGWGWRQMVQSETQCTKPHGLDAAHNVCGKKPRRLLWPLLGAVAETVAWHSSRKHRQLATWTWPRGQIRLILDIRTGVEPPIKIHLEARAWRRVEITAKPLHRQRRGQERDKDSHVRQASKLKAQQWRRKLTSKEDWWKLHLIKSLLAR